MLNGLSTDKDSAVDGLILAGGRSKRFGTDKARVPVDGVSMFDRVLSAIEVVCTRVLVSVASDQQRYHSSLLHMKDVYTGGGPLAGIHAGMRAAESDWMLVVATDYPFVTGETLKRLLAARSKSAVAVITRDSNGKRQPLCGCYRTDLYADIDARAAKGEFGIERWLDTFHDAIVVIDIAGPDVRNVNHPEDL